MKFLCQPLQKFQPEQVKVYHHTKNEVSIATASKVIVQTDRQTDRQTHRYYKNITSLAYAEVTIKVACLLSTYRHNQFDIMET